MSVKLTWQGLDEFRAALRNLPEHLTGEASHIAQGAANGAAVAVRTAYGEYRVTGNLQEHVFVEEGVHSRFGTAYYVKNSARHSHLFEHGTQARHTALGLDRGAGPPHNVFIPIMMRHRARMYQDLMQMMQREGLRVSGAA